MFTYSFEKLEVWQESRLLVKEIYSALKLFPDNEKYGLVSQIKRASVSVSSNIAEGATRTSFKDQAHFYQIAFSSLMEVLNQLILSVDLGFLNNEVYNKLREQIEKTGNQLNALRNAQLKKLQSQQQTNKRTTQ
jgi:four helix bundle protein